MVALARLALALFALLAGFPAGAEAQAPLERAVKAAYVYKFLAYVDWPAPAFESPDSPVVIGVTGADAIAAELALIALTRPAGERPILLCQSMVSN